MTSCVFCDSSHPFSPSDRYIVYENEFVTVSHMLDSDGPTYLGRLALQSKRHAHGYAELTDDEARAIGLATTRVSQALKSCTTAENVYSIFFAEVVPHLHLLMTARYPETPEGYWRMEILDWPDAPRGGPEDVLQPCDHMREWFAEGSVA